MNNDSKNEIKNNVTTGASTAVGATVGVVIGAALSPEKASAQEVPGTTQAPQPSNAQRPTTPATPSTPTQRPEKPAEQNPQRQPEPSSDEIEVVGYDRVTNQDGSQMDIAVVNVNGNEIGVVDVDLDGEADALICDANHNGIIEEGEMQIVQGEGIAMQPFADAAGFTPLYAQNDLPDYVNEADVDTYMA